MNTHTQAVDRRWFKRFGRTGGDTARARLLCFHHSGGSAVMYRPWRQVIPPSVDLIAVQLPGRADRFAEPARDRMEPLVSDLVEAVQPLLDRPFACYGASMGARVAWTLAHALRERAMPQPVRLYVASDPAPVTDTGTFPWEVRSDGLEGYLREMGGTPAEVLDQPELLQTLLPTLRADLAVLSTHRFRSAVPLDMPIRAFAGVDDPIGTPERMDSWRTETTAGFTLHRLPGGHFLGADAEGEVVRTIVQDIA